MENIKNLIRRAAVLLLAVTAFAACGSDDEEGTDEAPKTNPQELVGVWKVAEIKTTSTDGKVKVAENYTDFDFEVPPVMKMSADKAFYLYIDYGGAVKSVRIGEWYVQHNNFIVNPDNKKIVDDIDAGFLTKTNLVSYNGETIVASYREEDGDLNTLTLVKISEQQALDLANEFYKWYYSKLDL